MFDFANIRPKQIEEIPWPWTNETDEHGNRWVKDSPGVIKMPELAEYFDWNHFEVSCHEDKAALSLGTVDMKSVFTTAARFLGYDKLLVEQPDLGDIAAEYYEWNRRLLRKINVVTFFVIGDDVASNTGLLMSPDTWRSWLKPYLKELVELGQRHGCQVIYHSDGDIGEIVEDLVELDLVAIDSQPVGSMLKYTDSGRVGNTHISWNDDPEQVQDRKHWR